MAEAVRAHDAAVMAAGVSQAFEETIPVAGEERVYHMVKAPLRNPGGKIVGILGVARDITDRKRAEARLQASEERVRLAADVAGLGVLTIDYLEDTATPDAIAANLFGLTPHTPVTRSEFHARIHPDDRDEVLKKIDECLDPAGSHMFAAEHRVLLPDGTVRWLTVRKQVFFADIGGERSPLLAVLAAVDISEQKRAELALRDADRRKDEFLATLAHELRNPLAPIQNGVQILRLSGGADGPARSVTEMMDRQLHHLVRLIDDLLDVSRITRGKLHLRREAVSLAAVVDAAVETAMPLIERHGHQLTVAPLPNCRIDGDPTRLAQIFANLLTNAAEYSEPGGKITVNAAVADERREVVVSVKDAGVGIPPHHLHRVFDLFSQVDRSLEKTTGGLGIGLSLVKGLVEMHGGSVEARSEGEGRASEFIVRIPLTPGDTTTEAQAMDGSNQAANQRISVLIVDDNRDVADSMATMLKLFGNEVQIAYDGEEAVRAAGAFRPRAVFLDLGMPKLNGYDAARRIRSEDWGKDIVLIAMTGWGSEDDRRRTADAGFNHHLTKPACPNTLRQILADLEVAAV